MPIKQMVRLSFFFFFSLTLNMTPFMTRCLPHATKCTTGAIFLRTMKNRMGSSFFFFWKTKNSWQFCHKLWQVSSIYLSLSLYLSLFLHTTILKLHPLSHTPTELYTYRHRPLFKDSLEQRDSGVIWLITLLPLLKRHKPLSRYVYIYGFVSLNFQYVSMNSFI